MDRWTEQLLVPGGAIRRVVPVGVFGDDDDFDGHAEIHVYAAVEIRRGGRELWLRYGMTAEEPGGDHTAAAAEYCEPIFRIRAMDRRIVRVQNHRTEYRYLDDDPERDVVPNGPDQLVARFLIDGDHEGRDILRYTKVEMCFNPVRVELERS